MEEGKRLGHLPSLRCLLLLLEHLLAFGSSPFECSSCLRNFVPLQTSLENADSPEVIANLWRLRLVLDALQCDVVGLARSLAGQKMTVAFPCHPGPLKLGPVPHTLVLLTLGEIWRLMGFPKAGVGSTERPRCFA